MGRHQPQFRFCLCVPLPKNAAHRTECQFYVLHFIGMALLGVKSIILRDFLVNLSRGAFIIIIIIISPLASKGLV